MTLACILDAEGVELSRDEAEFFRDADPWGFILFRRNCESPDQVRRLCAQMRDAVGRDNAPILIDQEGGRVARLRPPHWRTRPANGDIGALYDRERKQGLEAAWLAARLIAHDLHQIGVNVDCAPMIDTRQPGAHDVIGDRAYSENPDAVADLGQAAIEGFLAGGVAPIIKHIPGHGRALCDSHLALPRVESSLSDLREIDFKPFKKLSSAPMGMTAHMVFEAVDPDQPATLSKRVIDEIIRGEIGFDGLLMTDDMSMKALSGELDVLAHGVLEAGCDIALFCNGSLEERRKLASGCRSLEGAAARRAAAALETLRPPEALDVDESEKRLANLLGDGLA